MTEQYFLKFLAKEDIILEPNGNNAITLIHNLPSAIDASTTSNNVLYTMCEGDTVPDSWKPYLQKATRILVPSKFVQDAFSKVGFETNVVPLGYDPEVFTFKPKVESNPYTFLHYEAFQDRKGWEDLLDAWNISGLAQEEFDAKLIFKTIQPFTKVTEILKSRNIELPYNVSVISGPLPHESINGLLHAVDCFVFPSRGEGFSLPPIEAMATGTPVILSKAHSHLDFYDERFMYGVDCNIKIPATTEFALDQQGSFVRCNVDILAKALRHVYDNKQEAKEKGELSSQCIKKYRYENTARMIKNILCQI